MIRSSMSSIPAGEWKRIFGYKKPSISMKVFYREIKKAAKMFNFHPPINPPPEGWQEAVYNRVKGKGVFKKVGKYAMVIDGKRPRLIYHK